MIYIAEELMPSNIISSFFTIKEGSSKIIPSFFTIKEGFFESLRLPLAKGSSTFLTKPLFNSLYAPFGSPSSGGQKPSGTRGCNRPPVLRTATL